MKKQIPAILTLCTLIFVLEIGPGFAHETSIIEDRSGIRKLWDPSAMAPWIVKTLDSDTDVGEHVSLEIDPKSGMTLVTYYDQKNGDLRLAMHSGSGGNCGPGNAWVCSTLDSVDDVGQYNDIAVYPLVYGPPDLEFIVSYFDATNGALKYAAGLCGQGRCSVASHTIDSGNPDHQVYKGKFTTVKYDSGKAPHIAYYYDSYYADDGLLYARYVGDGSGNCGEGVVAGNWQCDLIHGGEGIGMYASMYIDAHDNPSIAYYDGGNGYPLVARYYGSDSNRIPHNDWHISHVKWSYYDTGQHLSMYVDGNDKTHLAFYDNNNKRLGYAKEVKSGGNCGFNTINGEFEWQCDHIAPMGMSQARKGIAIAQVRGYPAIAYQDAWYDKVPAALSLARPVEALDPEEIDPNCGPYENDHTWYCQVIDGGSQYLDEARSVSVDVNSAGLMMIAYHELNTYDYPVTGNLKIAFQRLGLFLPLMTRELIP